MINVQELFERAKAEAELTLIEKGEIGPSFILYNHDGTMDTIAVNGRPAKEHKGKLFDLVKCACIASDTEVLTAIVEVWRTDSPDGFEAVIVHVTWIMNSVRKNLFSMREILRAADGSIAGLGDDKVESQDGNLPGNMGNLLPMDRPKAGARAIAKRKFEKARMKGRV